MKIKWCFRNQASQNFSEVRAFFKIMKGVVAVLSETPLSICIYLLFIKTPVF